VPTVRLDKERIERAITNLITDALQYSSADKPVVIRVEQHDHQAVICVLDPQVGVPSKHLPHLFERHFRAIVTATTVGSTLQFQEITGTKLTPKPCDVY